MLFLKSVYFYFLAFKIILIKKFKKIYFKTNFYNKSLITKVPDKIYFVPNPYLLSLITLHKKHLFKIANIDIKNLWSDKSKFNKDEDIHNFLWLNLIDRKIDNNEIQKILSLWFIKNSNYSRSIWSGSLLSKRIISWILNTDIILDNASAVFKNNFFKSIITQTNHLKKNLRFENDNTKKLENLCAILLTGLVFKEYRNNFIQGTKDLQKLLNSFFDNMGFPLNRNPNDLVHFSKYLILIKECIKDAQEYVPDFLDEIIEKNINNLNSIITPKNNIPLFNGSIEINLKDYLDYIDEFNYEFKRYKNENVGNLKIIKYKKIFIIFDIGSPPKKKYSKNYQSGPLSFELFFENNKVVTNCGFGSGISKKAMLLSRLTSAQSTLSLNETSVIKFERSKILNSAFGNSIKDTFQVFADEATDDVNKIAVSAKHNGYEKEFGYFHKRKLVLDKKDNSLIGSDELVNKNKFGSSQYNIRFHLYPGIVPVKTMGGNSVLIQIEKNKSLIFLCNKESISIEKSIFLGRNKILNNYCITISGKIENQNKEIIWNFKKNI